VSDHRSIDSAKFKQEGFLHLEGFFMPEEVEQIRREAMKVFLEQMVRHRIIKSPDVPEREFEDGMFEFFKRASHDLINCGKQVQHLISLHRLSLDPRVEGALRDLGLGFPNISTRPVLFFNSRHLAEREVYWKVFPHQDWRSMQGSLDAIVLWVPLCNIDVSLGALEIVPGSHKLGLVTTDVVEGFGKVDHFSDDDFVSLNTRQGDALFFSSFLVHRSGNNVTNSIRWSCHFRYNNLEEPSFVERGYPHPYLYKPQEELITPGFPRPDDLRRVFG
jgi:phytanoyl-CoA hydroxylase